jgi:hypothetical protein
LKTDPDIEPSVAATPQKQSSTRSFEGFNPLLQGAGFAALFIIAYAAEFLTSSLGDAYHRILPLTTIYRALLIATLLVWLPAWLGFAVCDRLPIWWKRVAWVVPFAFLPWLLCRDLRSAFMRPKAAHAGAVALPWAVPVAVGLYLALFLRPKILDKCILCTRSAYVIAAFSLLVILPKVVPHAFRSGVQEHASFERTMGPPVSPSAPRIVWVLLDELSYDQTFEHRQPDLALPNLDALSKTSMVFSAVQPVGTMTEELLPALLLGKPVAELRTPYTGLPSYRSKDGGPWERFNQHDTIFGDAHSLGWPSGLVGWYNPYCRLLPDVLSRCFWQYSDANRTGLSRFFLSTNTTAQNLAVIFPSPLIYRLFHFPLPDASPPRIRDYEDTMRHSVDLLRDPRIRFAFVHLPVPHPPGIYDRARQTMRQGGSYIDNLALADRSLGTLWNCIQSTPGAKNTTFIVSSDHSWRTYLWKPMGMWTPEDERATGGRFDPRPVLMVHLPGSTTAQTIARPTSELFVHTMLEAMLRNQIHSDADIAALPPGAPVAGQGGMEGKNKGHPPVASGRLVEMRAFGLVAVRLFQALLLGGRS